MGRLRQLIKEKNTFPLTLNTEVLEDEQATIDEPVINSGVYEELTFNLTPSVRHELLEGRNYSVVPMVMITEGVHAGSRGPLYYPSTELNKTPVVWNHKPIVVYHPTENGQGISACEPAVISKRKIGIIMNTRYEPGKKGQPGRLLAEAWLETERMTAVDDRVAKAIQNNQMMEVSTGLFTDNEKAIGLFKGKKYSEIARNYRPDHLAILPDMKGACSIKDGAGLLRNDDGSIPADTLNPNSKTTTTKSGSKSHDQIRQELQGLVGEKVKKTLPTGLKGEIGSPWIRDVFDTFLVYGHGGKQYKQDYETCPNGNCKLKGESTEVSRREVYTTTDGKVLNFATGDAMSKKTDLVDLLISNDESPWSDGDRATLLAMDIPTLEKITANKNPGQSVDSGSDDNDQLDDPQGQVKPKKAKSGYDGETKNGKGGNDLKALPKRTKKEETDDEDDAAPNVTKNQSVDEYINSAPPEVRELLTNSLKVHNQEKNRLIAAITANEQNIFEEDFLATKSLEELQGMAALCRNTQQNVPAQRRILTANYSGMGDVGNGRQQQNAVTNQVPLAIPVMNFSKKDKN